MLPDTKAPTISVQQHNLKELLVEFRKMPTSEILIQTQSTKRLKTGNKANDFKGQ